MKRLRRIGSVVAVALVLGVLGGGHASASLDADGPSSQPKTSGPVELDGSQCSAQVVRADSGAVLGNAEVCLFLYSFEALSEVDLLRDYGAGWLQARFVPAEGWCATDVGAELRFSSGRMESISKATAKARKATARMIMTAGGNALEDGKVSQAWRSNVGLAHAVAPEAGRPAIAIDWKGSSSKAITLVGGLGYSYEILQAAPEKISYGFSKFGLTSC